MKLTLSAKLTACFVALAILLGGAEIVAANPSFFASGVSTNNAASTTPAYMTPGNATSTTPVYDSYAPASQAKQFAANSAGVLQRFCASSTATVLTTSVEYSADNVDWYRNFVFDPSLTGTTTINRVLTTPYVVSQTFASSTIGGAAQLATNNCTTNAFTIPTPFRYLRIVQSVTGGNGSVWDQLVPIKELQ